MCGAEPDDKVHGESSQSKIGRTEHSRTEARIKDPETQKLSTIVGRNAHPRENRDFHHPQPSNSQWHWYYTSTSHAFACFSHRLLHHTETQEKLVCEICTFLNKISNIKCELCESPLNQPKASYQICFSFYSEIQAPENNHVIIGAPRQPWGLILSTRRWWFWYY